MLAAVAVLALLCGAMKSAYATYDGTPSTGSFTVVYVSSLAAASSAGTMAVVSTQGAVGSRVNIGAFTLREGIDWRVGASTFAAATSLAAAINANDAIPADASYSAGKAVITLTAVSPGALYNSVSLYSSTPTALSKSGAYLTGGQDNAVVKINSIPLMQGRDWFIQDVASNTAVNLAAATNHNPTLINQVEAVALGAVVYLRAVISPVAYTLSSSDPADLSVSGSVMTGGAAGNLARSICYLGVINSLPTANYPAGCMAYLVSAPTKLQISTETVVGTWSWLAK